MVDWKKVKCRECKSFKICRRESVTKGSVLCQERKKLVPPKKERMEKLASKGAMGAAFMWSMFGKKKEEQDEEEKD